MVAVRACPSRCLPLLADSAGGGTEVCDKYFATPELLAGHVAQHVPCTHQGCTFSAVPKVLQTHVEILHVRKIPTLDTPEEIARCGVAQRALPLLRRSLPARQVPSRAAAAVSHKR